MDTGSIRPVSTVAEATATRSFETSAPASVLTVLSAAKAITSARESEQPANDPRQQSFDDKAEIAATENVRRALAFDDATNLPVVRKMKGTQVVDQLPSEAYLRMRAALKESYEAAIRGHETVSRKA